MANRNYRYGKSSLKHIGTVRSELQKICYRAMEIANQRKLHCPDFGISRGLSTKSEQYELYLKGRDSWGRTLYPNQIVTNCDGNVLRSVHQDGLAVDFFAYIDGKVNYEPTNLALIATCFFEAASDYGIDIDWGGSWKSISDAPHIEITDSRIL